jgi:ATP-binding cassette subfamily F protein 3
MQSKNILQQALQQYEGTLMIVSHDRDFLDPIVNKTLEVQPGYIKTWLGNVSYYLDKKREEREVKEAQEVEKKSEKKKTSDPTEGMSRKEQRRFEAEKRNTLSRKVKPLKKRLHEFENDIEELEERKMEIEELMADPDFYDDEDRVKEISLEYETVKAESAEKMEKWEEIAGRIEHIENSFDQEYKASIS